MDITLKQRYRNLKDKLFADITELPAVFEQGHLPGLDGLRGVAILIVLGSHFAADTPLNVYLSGDIGVEMFFVISGFLITSLLLKEKVKYGKVSFKKFYIRRVLRITPVAYLFLLILILLNAGLQLGIPVKSFLASFLFFRNLPIRQTTDWWTAHFWSLSVEEQFYICFPFFIITRVNKFILITAILIIAIPAVTWLGYNNISIFYSNRVVHVITYAIIILLGMGTMSILIGALYAVLLFKKVIVIDKLKSNYFLSFVLLMPAIFILTQRMWIPAVYVAGILFAAITGYIILLNLKEKNFLRYFLDSALLKKIGVLSYSLYIWQQLFTGLQKWNLFKYSDFFLVRVLLLFIVSYISYTCYEKFFLRYKAKFNPG